MALRVRTLNHVEVGAGVSAEGQWSPAVLEPNGWVGDRVIQLSQTKYVLTIIVVSYEVGQKMFY